VLFLSAMRQAAADWRARGVRVRYIALDDPGNTQTFAGEIARAIADLRPAAIRAIEPGDHRVRREIEAAAGSLPLELLPDEHFLTTREQFRAWATGRKPPLIMEFFYREQRRRLGVLVDDAGQPEGGTWNYDADNRLPFPKSGPSPRPPRPRRFAPSSITREVIETVRRVMPDLPGSIDDFGWPTTPAEAMLALDDFIATRLASFGPYEDAMWTGEPWTYHSQLSPALNLKLLDPRDCVSAALAAYRAGRAPLQSTEAFIRQIIGWREFIRGVYFFEGDDYGSRNTLAQFGSLPRFYWNADTDMNCLRHAIGEVLDHGYGHHIQRLMVIGNFALISGVHPREISDWFLAMYADAVDWVTLPNTLGMVMHADARTSSGAGIVGTKPYAASGQYISRMSNYCSGCRYDPKERHGPRACPFTTFYWDFLIRHRERFASNPRMAMILKNVDRLSKESRAQLTVSAASLRAKYGIGDPDAPRDARPGAGWSADIPARAASTLFDPPSKPSRRKSTK
jgi:deoxyribodipyrimidine photolyase-related protein